MTLKKTGWVACLLASLCFTACLKLEKEESQPKNYNVSGKVEKGPFVSGSTIDIQPLDANMRVLGSVFSSSISDNYGSFDLGSKRFDTPYAQLTANGYFFNEVTGNLSKGTLTLKAVVNLASKETINVNLLTHLKYQRILNLIAEGKSFDESNTQAQKELLTAFGLQRFVNTDVSQYSIAAGTDEAGALIAISSLLLVNRSEAEFTEYLAKINLEFSKSGTFSEALKQQIIKDRTDLNNKLSRIQTNIVSRYKELGQSISVKDLSYFFDWNNDGIAGNEITDQDNPVTLDISEIKAPMEGGEYTVRITSSIPLSLTSSIVNDTIEVVFFDLFEKQKISYTKVLDNQTLKISINPASARIMESSQIKLYDYRGKEVAMLPVTQSGDPSKKLFTDDGSSYILNTASLLSTVINLYNDMDSRYTQIIPNSDFTAPVSPTDSRLSYYWDNTYIFIKQNLRTRELDLQSANMLEASVNSLNALSYYKLISLYGGVPYRTLNNMNDMDGSSMSRTAAHSIFESLTVNLQKAINSLDNKKNAYADNAEDFLLFSKDVPRIILADIYMYQGHFMEASALLKEVISNGFYKLENTIEYSSTSNELIYGLPATTKSTSSIIPVLTYSDVILSLAECEQQIGNISSAKRYLDEVAHAKNIMVPTDIKKGIQEARKTISTEFGGYFAYLKRNGIAISELGLKDYQLLLPIPYTEIIKNQYMTQNPGY